MTMLVRYVRSGTAAIGAQIGGTIYDLSSHYPSVTAWLNESLGGVGAAIGRLEALAAQTEMRFLATELAANQWLAPLDERGEVWAAGVTYERSRAARQEEAIDGGDVYARVYGAERPELFYKAPARQVVGHLSDVGIRSDATWSVPEPELAVVFNSALDVVGFSVGNDMSSRDIEGANPLYLPQAKVYTAACALGPGIVLNPASEFPQTAIKIEIKRAGQVAFAGETHTSRLRRTVSELADYLGRCNTYPDGVVLLTGTGVVPPNDFTLAAGDMVTITIDGIGTLKNTVKSSLTMHEVRPWLFIGKYSETLNRDLLDRCKIRAILQLAAPVEHRGIETLYIPVDDGAPVRSEALANGVAFIRSEYARGERVLVACGAGISRSVTFTIAALKEEEGLSLLDAFREIAQVHPDGMPHPELWRSLCEYYGEDVPFLDMWRQIRTSLDQDEERFS